jgi:hypothetical protein
MKSYSQQEFLKNLTIKSHLFEAQINKKEKGI